MRKYQQSNVYIYQRDNNIVDHVLTMVDHGLTMILSQTGDPLCTNGFFFWFDAINLGWFIVYIEGSTSYNFISFSEESLRKNWIFTVCHSKHLTLKVPITTAADDKFCDIFPNFRKKIRHNIS